MAKTQKQIADERRARGMCPRCGQRPPEPGKALCKKDQDYLTRKATERREKQQSSGLCTHNNCKNKARPGFKTCETCAADYRESTSKRSTELKSQGLCVGCGDRKAANGHDRCEICHANNLGNSKVLRDTRKARGMCAMCGDVPTEADEVLCDACHVKQTGTLQRRAESRRSRGLCVGCGNNPTSSETLCDACLEYHKDYNTEYNFEQRTAVLDAYGGPACVGCGCNDRDVLQIDHIEGGGYRHRKEINCPLGQWLYKNNFPPGFRILCANCNLRAHRGLILPLLPGEHNPLCLKCDKPRDRHFQTCYEHTAQASRRHANLKIEILDEYGGPTCCLCGESEILLLQLDHVDGGGNAHAIEISRDGGWESGRSKMYVWLKEHKFPSGFRVLCANCNTKLAQASL